MTPARIERRHAARLTAADGAAVPPVRIRPGHAASIVDISAGGALVESERGLSPGTHVELQLIIAAQRCSVRGRVLRCAVAEVHAAGVRYRSAIAFDQQVPWPVRPDGYAVPALHRSDDRGERAHATHGRCEPTRRS